MGSPLVMAMVSGCSVIGVRHLVEEDADRLGHLVTSIRKAS